MSNCSTKQRHKDQLYKSKWRFCGDKDETINYRVSKCRKLAEKSIRIDMTDSERYSNGNCARNWNLIILSNGTNVQTRNHPRVWEIKFSKILRYKQITEDQTKR